MQQRYLIGTLFEEEELNKKMNINNTKLKDPMGNVRWKGAFTGGFEAGFKNTCGSKEGWTPSSFVSSVGNRGEKKEQNIFDFMDKEDLGRESIGQNMSMRQNFQHSESNPFNIKEVESMGEKILNKMKKKEAFINAPEDIKELQKLLENYEKYEEMEQENENYNLKGVDGYTSVGFDENIPDDDFIVAYEDFFRKVIRAGVKEETEEEMMKRREENKVYFDFTKPLDEEPEYLKEIQDLEEASKPKKRRKNTINDKNLKDLFRAGAPQLKVPEPISKAEEIPEDYDPYHRIKSMKESEKQFIVNVEERKKHKFYSLGQRSDLLSEGKLASRFVSAGGTGANNIQANKFVRSSQEEKAKDYEKVFEDLNKNRRYWDYVMELEGKKISAQLEYLSYEEAEKEKEEFEKIYQLRQLPKNNPDSKELPNKVESALKLQNRKEIKIIRKTGTWKPERALCKKFGCVMPYKEEDSSHRKDHKNHKHHRNND